MPVLPTPYRLAVTTVLLMAASASAAEFRKLTVSEYRDRMKAGWLGQMAGVTWGGPTEFKFKDQIIPEDKVPKWLPKRINDAFNQDDLYVEMTFLRSLEEYGLDVSIRQAGIDFANSGYKLWCANYAGRSNLRDGIAPPDSSHPKFNNCPNDIDYQIEADFSGLIAPGMPQVAIDLGEKFGRLMNYSDGMYAGQFMGAMYATAFFERDRIKVIEAALKCIPDKCQYAEMVRDMLSWYRENPTDWQATWAKCQKKYREDPEYQKCSNGGIDVKINGAYLLMGLLYGNGEYDPTIVIAMRCGQDSDCNPSSAAGVFFTMMGLDKIPARFIKELDETQVFSHTAYSFPKLLNACEKLARQYVVRAGGRIDKDADGREVFVIPVQEPRPSKLEQSWEPGPIAGSVYGEDELAKIKEPGPRRCFAEFAPGWKLETCGSDMSPGPKKQMRGREHVFVTHPVTKTSPCRITREAEIAAGKKATLRLGVGHHETGDWLLVVNVDGEKVLEKPIGASTSQDGWLDVDVDLSRYAGKKVKIEVLNQATGWEREGGYWSKLSLDQS